MLSNKEKYRLAVRWRPYLETLLYVWCLAHGMKKAPFLEIGEDDACYAKGTELIHLGVGMIEAATEEELFAALVYLLGHEFQHVVSTTDKDWNAAHKLCFRNACQRLSVKVFGRARRLTKESDYDNFFKELADEGIFVNQKLLMTYANFVLNTVEDGRIENLRQKNHPGFGNYRKVFRGGRWLRDDFTDEEFFKEDPSDLDELGTLKMLMGQIYYLSTLGIYQKGFLEAYGGTKAHKLAESYIGEISAGVLARTCKVCMEHARNIFDRLLDMVLDACTLEANAEEVQKFLEDLLQKLLDEAANQQLSATPSSEEQGDGLPAESLFGQTELEIEVDKETYEELKEKAEETGAMDMPGVKIKVKADEGEDDEEEEGSASGSRSSDDASNSKENEPSSEKDSSSPTNQNEDAEGESEDANGNKSGNDSPSDDAEGSENAKGSQSSGDESSDAKEDGEKSSDSGESGEALDSDEVEEGNSSMGESLFDTSADSKGINNRVENASASEAPENLEEEIRSAMEKAAEKAKADFELAEADAKLDEAFSKAASTFEAVQPAEVDLSAVNSRYDDKVRFIETTRAYSPVGRLPLELENTGCALKRQMEAIIRNKQDPDQRYLKSGMLDTRRLSNLAMGDFSVFKRRGQPVKTDVACFLLQDNSGSMGDGPGSTRFACCNAFAVLEEGFKDIMPLKIAAFDSGGVYDVTHEVIKEFDEVGAPNLSYNFRDLGRSGYGNKDGYSIRVATQQLLARPEKDKILIIASDGFPTEYVGGQREGCADVKNAVAEARRAGVRTIGMYMYHEQDEDDFAKFRDMYGPEIIFASLDEIGDQITPILRRYF